MSSTWSQQPQARGNAAQQLSAAPPVRKNTNPPPICMRCEGEHFVKDCPQANGTGPAGFGSAPAPYSQASGSVQPPQSFPPQGGSVQYPSYPPNQQPYGPPGPQYTYNQPQQTYTAPPPNQQYPRPGFQPPPYNQYNQSNGTPQFASPVHQPAPQQYNAHGPGPHQAAMNNYHPQNNSYGGGFQSTPSPVPYQPPPQQWNNRPSSSHTPFQKPQRSNSGFQREYSGTPSHHSQQQQPPQSQSQQMDYGFGAFHQTPQTPSSNSGSAQQVQHQVCQSSPVKLSISSIPSTPASQSNVRRHSTTASVVENFKPELVEKEKAQITSEQEAEEGEVQEGDEEEELFAWEIEHIFKEPQKAETVALAQPLSASFKSTPVPLVQAWSTKVPSISRYARKENLKEFVKSIRTSPQWSYLQEDPAFAEIGEEGELIPLNELAAWMDIHHGRTITVEEQVEEPAMISKKRSRSDGDNVEQENEQENVDHQIALEAAIEEQPEEPPTKRQKNDEAEDSDEITRTPGGRTPIIGGRGGTPCLATTDDAWAPRPGEHATSPADPTEALLASLGVEGSPKPVKQEPLPPYVPNEQQNHSPESSQNQTPVVSQRPNNGAPLNAQGPGTQNIPQNRGPPMATGPPNNPQYGLPTNPPYGNGNIPNPLYGHGPPANNIQGTPQSGPPMNAPYGNGPTHNMQGPQPYGPPAGAPYVNGPPNNYQQGPPHGPPQVPPQWGPQRNPSFGNALQYNAPQEYPQYGPPQTASYSSPPYGPPASQYANAPPVQYPQGPPQYNQIRQPSYGPGPPMQGQYGPNTQTSPTQYSPPQNIPYGTAPYPNHQSQYQNVPAAGYGNGPPNCPPNNVQFAQMPPNQPPYGNAPYGHVPPRQDSGYISARGSYSSGSAPNGFNNQASPQNPTQMPQVQPLTNITSQHTTSAGAQVSESSAINQHQNGGSENSNENAESNETAGSSPGTPLSPTSAEILGRLVRKSSKGKAGQSGGSVRKVKRPQPVVAEAYSRRW